jgi:hypothetical protein
MLGIIFTELADYGIDKVGLTNWNRAMAELQLPSQGAYTTGQRYDDGEAMRVFNWLGETTGQSVRLLLNEFGYRLFDTLRQRTLGNYMIDSDFVRFLKHIDKTTHDKVRSYFPDSSPPDFKVTDTEGGLVMHYRSDRKLCFLAEGLIQSSADFYQTDIQLVHDVCMHQGADHCEITVLIHD